MYIAKRLRQLRESKKLSQGDTEKRTGLLPCYVSRLENGHIVPAVETLQKLARAFEVPMYQFFYGDKESPILRNRANNEIRDWASYGRGQRLFSKLCGALSKASRRDRELLLTVVAKMISLEKSRKEGKLLRQC